MLHISPGRAPVMVPSPYSRSAVCAGHLGLLAAHAWGFLSNLTPKGSGLWVGQSLC